MTRTPPTLIGLATLMMCGVAFGQQAVKLDIEAQPLDRALNSWANQTGYQVLIPVERAARGQIAPSLKGRYTPEGALKVLLASTDLKYEFVNAKTVTIRAAVVQSDSAPPPGTAHSGQEGAAPLVLAQSRPRQTQAAAESEVTDPSSQGASSDRESTSQEVIVTAQRRSERLQDVPISISVLNGKELDRSPAAGVADLLNQVPGVTATTGFQIGGAQMAVRGVTAAGATYLGSSPIGYYLDFVPFGFIKSAMAPDSAAYDLERVEILRGPQGTLYGASAQNGVVRVLTHDADLDDFSVKARTSFSSTEEGGGNYRGDMALNAPIVPGKLAARVVLGYQNLSGWIDRPTQRDANDTEIKNVRLRLNAAPTEKLSLGLSAWHSESDSGAFSTGFAKDESRAVAPEPVTVSYDAVGVKVGYDFDSFTISSMTSYLDYKSNGFIDYSVLGLANTRLQTTLNSQLYAEEINVNSAMEGPWRWSVGGIYRDVKDELYQFRRQYVAPTQFGNTSQSYAAFGELTRAFLDGRLELTGGLRYFKDDVTGTEYSRNTALLPGQTLVKTDNSFDAVSPRAVLTWHPVRDATVYASYAEGFRSGFPQNPNIVSIAPQFPPLDADNLKNYEVGTKGTYGPVILDAAVFYIDWKDVQQSLTVNAGTPTNPITLAAFVNGQSASGIGAEIGISAEVMPGLSFGLTGSWNDLTMDADVFSGGVLLFAKGDRLNQSAEYTFGASANYSFPFGGKLSGHFALSANYNSALDVHNIVGGRQVVARGDELLIGRASFSVDSSDRWSVGLFADNFTNEQGTPLPYPSPVDWSTHLRPRTIGIQADYRF